MLFLCRLFGMELIFSSRESYRDKPALFESLFSGDKNAFFIDEGGASPEAVQGCSELIDELDETYDHIFCACGTGTTTAGLINGIETHGLNTLVHGVPALKGSGFIRNEINKYLIKSSHFELHTDYHFGGYAKTTPALLQFIQDFSQQSAVLIDPVYTGKMMYALFDLAAKGYFKRGDKILAVHTGGLFGLLGMRERFFL